MLMPESKPPRYLQRAEVEATLVALTQDAAEMARIMKLARIIAHGLSAIDPEDLLQTAMTRLLSGSRKWPRGLSALTVIKGVMRSVAYRARTKPGYLLAEDQGALSNEDAEDESSPLGEGVSLDTDPARVVEADSELSAAQRAVAGDEELELLVEALAEGLTGVGLATELGWDQKKYDAARKRLSRRLAALKTNRSSP